MAYSECHFFAKTLGVSTSMNVLLPQPAASGQVGMKGSFKRDAYPVLYLFHGWSDDETIWMRRTSIERYAAELGLIVVMPRVELSYYQNMATGMRFWDFISEELPGLCGQWFPVSSKRGDTFAAGLSMGGYGAFRLGLSCPERYSAVASLSGALNLNGGLSEWKADPARRPKLEAIWGMDFQGFDKDSDLLFLAGQLSNTDKNNTRFYQWCGTEDFLYADNQRFREHADKEGLNLTYREGPGDHSWEHWDREIQGVLSWMFPQKDPAPPSDS